MIFQFFTRRRNHCAQPILPVSRDSTGKTKAGACQSASAAGHTLAKAGAAKRKALRDATTRAICAATGFPVPSIFAED
jgi:hypothetical protein